MREAPTTEAKARFSAILRTMQRGDTVCNTKHWRRIAVLQNVPEDTVQSQRAAALQRMDERRRRLPREASLGEMRSWIREGRA